MSKGMKFLSLRGAVLFAFTVQTLAICQPIWAMSCSDLLAAVPNKRVVFEGEKISPADKYREAIGETVDPRLSPNERNSYSKVKTSFRSFEDSIMTEIGDRHFSVSEFLGYSGAGYGNLGKFESNFARKIIETNKRTLKEGGANAVTVLVLGGSKDGFGKGYEIIRQLQEEGQIKNVLVAGMVSEGVVKYHLEGIQKGWGEVIAGENDVLFLMKTYRQKDGSTSWELKERPEDASKTVEILTNLGSKDLNLFTSMEIFEGGKQAFREGIEYMLETYGKSGNFELTLNVEYDAGRATKDTGFRAATNITYTPQELHHGGINVRIFNLETYDSTSFNAFYNSPYGLRVRADNWNPIAYVESQAKRVKEREKLLRQDPENKDLSAELDVAKAELRRFEVVLQIKNETSSVLGDFQKRTTSKDDSSNIDGYLEGIPISYRSGNRRGNRLTSPILNLIQQLRR